MSENGNDSFERVKSYLGDLGLTIIDENATQELVVVDDEEHGIKNLVVDCESPIVVMEQLILEVPAASEDFFRRLLQINRTLVHGAFVLDEAGERVFFRDTLQLENLDRNELEGSVAALSLALAEYASELLDFAQGRS